MAKVNDGRKGTISSYSCRVSITEGSEGSNRGQAVKQRPRRSAAYRLAQSSFLCTQDHFLRDGAAHSEQGAPPTVSRVLPLQQSLWKMHHSLGCGSVLRERFLNRRSSSQMTLACVKLTKINKQTKQTNQNIMYSFRIWFIASSEA